MTTQEVFAFYTDHFLIPTGWTTDYPWLVAGFTTRKGGVSQFPFSSFNCALHVGDSVQAVLANRQRLVEQLGLTLDDMVCGEQVHGVELYYVRPGDKGRGSRTRESAIPGVDGLYTDYPSILLTSFYADCVPLYFIDVRLRVVGLAHAGWKGTVGQIGPKMVRRWKKQFGSRPQDIKVLIGPSIGGCCYEVDDRVISALEPLKGCFTDEVILPKPNGRYMLDLKQLNHDLLKQAGIPQANIEVSGWCTSCRTDLFFSYRKEQGRTGRLASFIMIK
ncbi:laccase domain protein YlmD [Caldalkalibacillus thermarum]|uniref:peptidoglycan editing factor PgeF n=1 Tax=Caldalkalibacillus thermarum TaxID=296745 RepID=UPI00166AB390|nr:peptidoglycan editing factor PgeF [Caldalkalibacillus thermarum]GGK15753.1 laccase domain protein YlmD [Caldalkalibacillus thermarum]